MWARLLERRRAAYVAELERGYAHGRMGGQIAFESGSPCPRFPPQAWPAFDPRASRRERRDLTMDGVVIAARTGFYDGWLYICGTTDPGPDVDEVAAGVRELESFANRSRA